MPATIRQRVTFDGPPERLYALYMDSRQHAAATGAPARIGRRPGSAFTAWGGYCRGRTLALVPGRLVVQTWRASDWKRSDPDSVLLLEFEAAGRGTRVSLTHAAVPSSKARSLAAGWREFYWRPWRAHLRPR